MVSIYVVSLRILFTVHILQEIITEIEIDFECGVTVRQEYFR